MTIEALATSSIIVDRADRQRRELKNIPELADSIARLGLIHPIVVDENNKLIAGERRFRAHQHLGLPTILARRFSDLTEHDRVALELEENIKREDITWDERCRAVQRYHDMRKSDVPDWSHDNTANELGLSRAHISKLLLVAGELERGNTMIAEAPKFSTAVGIVQRQQARAAASAVHEFREAQGIAVKKIKAPILVADFNEWAATYTGPRFNFLHCDFPYGINAGSFDQGSAATHGGYADDPEVYWRLLDTLAAHQDKFLHPVCHLMFWFSPKWWTETHQRLTAAGWTLAPYPLIWHKSDGAGILPDPQRGPRHAYEMAFFGYRGDAKIIRAKSNLVSAPTTRDTHMSEKSQEMLAQFFSMIVDTNTAMLDPTCGSGSALRAAATLGAQTLGLERDEEFARRAILKYQEMFK